MNISFRANKPLFGRDLMDPQSSCESINAQPSFSVTVTAYGGIVGIGPALVIAHNSEYWISTCWAA
jgi:hypothetical protein